ncbi:nuclear transport factor 2 family protein [Sphingomonas sp.]|uniref:nuclear transport factor 2 family protein n=1 Tax=Sphingomonas sp. TaxID=28214 RepID=UPI003B009FC2
MTHEDGMQARQRIGVEWSKSRPDAEGVDLAVDRMIPIRQVLERFYAAEDAYMTAERPKFAPIAAILHSECLLRQPAALPYGGEWRGHAGFERWMRAFRETWSSLSVQNARIFQGEDEAVVFSRSHVQAVARATGRRADWLLLQQVVFRDGLILRLEPFHWDTAAILPALSASGAAPNAAAPSENEP